MIKVYYIKGFDFDNEITIGFVKSWFDVIIMQNEFVEKIGKENYVKDKLFVTAKEV